MVRCSNCGAEVEGSFCSHCGSKLNSHSLKPLNSLSEIKFCPNCANEMHINLSVCPKCNYEFNELESNNKLSKNENNKYKLALIGVLSFFIPGLGHIIFKDYKKGFIFIIISMFIGLFVSVIVYFIISLIVLYHFYKTYV